MSSRTATVFIGDVALDEYFSAPVWPGVGDKAWVSTETAEVGGMIANAASVHAALGADVRFLTTMNDSAVSRRLLADLVDQGIDTGLCRVDPRLADSRCLIFLVGDQHVVITPEIGDQRFELDESTLAELAGSRSVYSSIGDLRRLRHGQLAPAQILSRIRQGGARIVLDLDVGDLADGDAEIIGCVDVCIVNRIGFERLAAGRTVQQTVSALLEAGMTHLVVTQDEDGATVYSTGGADVVPGIRAAVVDVTGAGDTFCSAFLFALDRTDDPALAARFANGAGARATERHGARAGVASVTEIVAYLAAAGHDISALEAALLPADLS
ncbi:carbohydrate kinase family protein [Leifsonia sp. YAF41]|uniref:carbohydrate kinase family protein n=1 Tax=Leifsonia sp. YAF41 TaxID=3233086 RepID=UPI003F96A481